MTDTLTRLTAALADNYRIERELGQGGMATVYLAEDLKHHRNVAIKVLREDLAATLGSPRFLREIQIAAQLQHPNILPLLDSGVADGFLFYVMPYVSGQSLRERLAREGELPVHEAVRLITEVVDALAHAHEHGVVHRDVKPDNVMLSGRHALVTDFGVAKAVSEATGGNMVTTLGVALGTPTYMSPEQAAADPNIDHRSDIYAVGVMAYELLTGRPPFVGSTPQQVLAAHVTEVPDPVTKRRQAISPALEAIVMRCLAKRPADRFQTAAELLSQLEPLATPSVGMTPTQTRPMLAVSTARGRWLRVGAPASVLLVAVAAGYFWVTRPPATAELLQAVQLTRSVGIQEGPAITSDGRGVAYRNALPGDSFPRMELRRGADGSAVELAPLGMPRTWSPDGSTLLFATGRGLQSVPSLGGVSSLVVPGSRHGAWGPQGGELVYVLGDSILRRGQDGEPMLLAMSSDPHSLVWSPDEKWVAFVSENSLYELNWNIATSSLWLVSADGGIPIRLTDGEAMDMSPTWAPDSRRLLFVSSRGGTRDIYQLNLTRGGQPRGTPLRLSLGLNASKISLSADGTQLAYSVATNHSRVWNVAIPAVGFVSSRTAEAVTSDQESIESVDISHDGKWLYFDSDRAGMQQIFRRPLAGGPVQQLTSGDAPKFAVAVSPDGKEFAYHAIVNQKRRVFVGATEGGSTAVQVSPGTLDDERNAAWSPDGRWLSWESQAPSGPRAFVVPREAGGFGAPREVARPGALMRSAWVSAGGLAGVDSVQRRFLDASVEQPAAAPRHVSNGFNGTALTVLATDALHILIRDQVQQPPALWRIPVAGGVVREVVRFDDPRHPSATMMKGWIEHGGRIYFTLQDPTSNIWVAPVKGLAH